MNDKQAAGFLTTDTDEKLAAAIGVDKMMEYSIKDGILSLKAVTGGTDTGVVHADATTSKFNKDSDRFTVDSKVYMTNEDTYFFVKTKGTFGTAAAGDKYAIVKASEITNFTEDALKQYAKDEKAISTMLFGVISSKVSADSTDSVYAFVTGDAYQGYNEKGEVVVYLPVKDKNGNEVTLISNKNLSESAALKNNIITYTIAAETKVATVTPVTAIGGMEGWVAGEVDAVSGNLVSLNNGNLLLTLADDVIINNVKTTDTNPKWVEGKEIVASVNNVNNVIYKTKTVNNVTVITEIIVEVDGAVMPY